ncbi:death ligand signal enhancer [Triplophysa rosa]|uniref:Death ligand signal enhancer n=1 Tax=Triplophysa rosa TaxID=992332 RepID=A0A9W7TD25_TRIRA|nr:death ligand signal enhancer [Triplophysa rosa]KAI7793912.1 death ligand signal enhancer [Triplophysa rosa]
MWRFQSLVSRVLSRCHGNAQLRLSQGHHVEDEVINTSILTAGLHAGDSSSQRGEDHQNTKRTFQFCYTGLPRYTALDAVGWGAAAVLFVQVCRRIHSQFSSHADQNSGPAQIRDAGFIQKCTYKALIDIFSKQNVLPSGVTVRCLRGALQTSEQSDSCPDGSHGNSDGSSDGDQQVETASSLSHSEETLFPERPEPEKSLTPDEAAQNLKHTADCSVPIILNIMGLENAKAGDCETAFLCFLASAQHNYSKAQFNVGVCYEKGRGVQQDHTKAVQYYRRAAAAGHHQAQYRCAKLLLSSRGQQCSETDTALSYLHTAADAGLTEAQMYLGVVLSECDEMKSGQYFRRAAQSGDSRALVMLAQCYETGFGVSQCVSTAVSLYQQAADRGNKQARDVLRDTHRREVLRSIRSAPCFSVIGHLNLNSMYSQKSGDVKPHPQQQCDWPTQPLPHSWSTGSLTALPSVTLQTLNADSRRNVWTLGVR